MLRYNMFQDQEFVRVNYKKIISNNNAKVTFEVLSRKFGYVNEAGQICYKKLYKLISEISYIYYGNKISYKQIKKLRRKLLYNCHISVNTGDIIKCIFNLLRVQDFGDSNLNHLVKDHFVKNNIKIHRLNINNELIDYIHNRINDQDVGYVLFILNHFYRLIDDAQRDKNNDQRTRNNIDKILIDLRDIGNSTNNDPFINILRNIDNYNYL